MSLLGCWCSWYYYLYSALVSDCFEFDLCWLADSTLFAVWRICKNLWGESARISVNRHEFSIIPSRILSKSSRIPENLYKSFQKILKNLSKLSIIFLKSSRISDNFQESFKNLQESLKIFKNPLRIVKNPWKSSRILDNFQESFKNL